MFNLFKWNTVFLFLGVLPLILQLTESTSDIIPPELIDYRAFFLMGLLANALSLVRNEMSELRIWSALLMAYCFWQLIIIGFPMFIQNFLP